MAKGEEVAKTILGSSSAGGNIEMIKLELDCLDSVRAAASDFLSKSNQLNILINNAGEAACLKPSKSSINTVDSQQAGGSLSGDF